MTSSGDFACRLCIRKKILCIFVFSSPSCERRERASFPPLTRWGGKHDVVTVSFESCREERGLVRGGHPCFIRTSLSDKLVRIKHGCPSAILSITTPSHLLASVVSRLVRPSTVIVLVPTQPPMVHHLFRPVCSAAPSSAALPALRARKTSPLLRWQIQKISVRRQNNNPSSRTTNFHPSCSSTQHRFFSLHTMKGRSHISSRTAQQNFKIMIQMDAEKNVEYDDNGLPKITRVPLDRDGRRKWNVRDAPILSSRF